MPKTPSLSESKNTALSSLKKYYDNDSFNDLTIRCNDGKTVRCQNYMLRINSDVFNDILNTNDDETKVSKIDFPFSSAVMEHVKLFCHLGTLETKDAKKKASKKESAVEVAILMDVIVAADYFNIADLGTTAAGCVSNALDEVPNLAFLVFNKFGIETDGETREAVKKAISYARDKIRSYNRGLLVDPTFNTTATLQVTIEDYDVLKKVVNLIPMESESAELPLQFIAAWINVHSIEKSAEEVLRVKLVAKKVIEETELLKKIGEISPKCLVDKDGIVRASTIVSPASIMDAIYETSSDWEISTRIRPLRAAKRKKVLLPCSDFVEIDEESVVSRWSCLGPLF